ncbi:hypothetical protein [Pontibacter akesuensis]|uniref:Uncharacterized protein n=1 Tax=Pontibacter akesuensis TaxID=388950 RepID=A0A1I7K1C7_9BACT|nr:hypothetical protein [Pontibacter akesuensis]GHA75849.1 hypothetical protein GCM10007389_32220 [Pontibacter akesuensis]SFU91227.1 hypothetical protein SAMN04487941_3282 [Pontibacter akesuensis]
MGKRQIRIHRTKLPDHTFELLQSPAVQVVLRNRIVLAGVLKELNGESLQLQDFRANHHTFPLEQVEEIIYDVEAAY